MTKHGRTLALWTLPAQFALLLVAPSLHAQQIDGLVWNGNSGSPLPGVEVRATYLSEELVGSATTDATGGFSISLEEPGSYLVTASLDGYVPSEPKTVEVGRDETVALMLELQPLDPTGLEVRPSPATGRTTIIYGQVLEGGSSRPVADAEVTLEGMGGADDHEVGWTVHVPGGRAWAGSGPSPTSSYATLHEEFDVAPGQAYQIIARVREDPIPLKGIEVTVRSRPTARLQEVLSRMDRDLGGAFFTTTDFERQGSPPVAHMLDGVPSTRVVRSCWSCVPSSREFSVNGRVRFDGRADWSWFVTLRGGCVPSIYLDGMLVSRPGDGQAEWVGMSTGGVEIVEVFPGPATLPPEYNDPGTFCAIGIWTKRGG